jgi:hypothetical protein
MKNAGTIAALVAVRSLTIAAQVVLFAAQGAVEALDLLIGRPPQ